MELKVRTTDDKLPKQDAQPPNQYEQPPNQDELMRHVEIWPKLLDYDTRKLETSSPANSTRSTDSPYWNWTVLQQQLGALNLPEPARGQLAEAGLIAIADAFTTAPERQLLAVSKKRQMFRFKKKAATLTIAGVKRVEKTHIVLTDLSHSSTRQWCTIGIEGPDPDACALFLSKVLPKDLPREQWQEIFFGGYPAFIEHSLAHPK